jgi:hypothetical protein
MKDLLGFSFTLGCTVARPVLFGKSPVIEIPSRLLIIDHDPLIKMMDDHSKELENETS